MTHFFSELAKVELLEESLESIEQQTMAPRALWVCWYASEQTVRRSVEQVLERMMPRPLLV